MQRLKKAEAIRKMLSETTPITAPEVEGKHYLFHCPLAIAHATPTLQFFMWE
jgi:hypothetical protein